MSEHRLFKATIRSIKELCKQYSIEKIIVNFIRLRHTAEVEKLRLSETIQVLRNYYTTNPMTKGCTSGDRLMWFWIPERRTRKDTSSNIVTMKNSTSLTAWRWQEILQCFYFLYWRYGSLVGRKSRPIVVCQVEGRLTMRGFEPVTFTFERHDVNRLTTPGSLSA